MFFFFLLPMNLHGNQCNPQTACAAHRAGASLIPPLQDLFPKGLSKGVIPHAPPHAGENTGRNSKREARGTVDSERHLAFPCADPRHHGSAHVLPGVFLADGLERQLVLIAQDLEERRGLLSGWAMGSRADMGYKLKAAQGKRG